MWTDEQKLIAKLVVAVEASWIPDDVLPPGFVQGAVLEAKAVLKKEIPKEELER